MEQAVYIILRNGRKAEPNFYLSKDTALSNIRKMQEAFSTWDSNSKNNFTLVKTKKPHQFL
jgi:hypothetical protein